MKTLRFDGDGFEYFKIWIVNLLLIIVTLGLYYPWAKVRHLRYFYGNTILEERNFDYHATGKQLFMAYLIALALFIAYMVISNVFAIGGILVVIALFVGIPWIIWRSMMFGMRMTSFSNVRFSFDGDLKQAYINFFLLPLLMLVVIYSPILLAVGIPSYLAYSSNGLPALDGGMSIGLGLLVFLGFIAVVAAAIYLSALIKKRNTMYLINGTQYGQGRFHTQLDTKVFVKILLKTIGLALLMIFSLVIGGSILGSIAFAGIGLLDVMSNLDNSDALAILLTSGSFLLGLFLFYFGLLFGGFVIGAYWKSRQRNYIVNNTTLDNKIALASTLKARSLAWVMITNLLLVIVTLGFGMPWAKVRMARYVIGNTQVDTELGIDGYVSQQQQYQSSLGDQIGDAFDVDLGLAI